MSRRTKMDALLLITVAGLYLLGPLWKVMTEGWMHDLLVCYYSDILAGVFLLAWTSLLLQISGRKPLHSFWKTAVLLLLCGSVWECLAPVWKEGAVFDPWDFAAYQLGGLLYLFITWFWDKK